MGVDPLKAVRRLQSRAVLLDRDGVVNQAVVRDGKPYPPADVTKLELVPDAAEALARLKKLGFLLIVVTNQPEVARGRQCRSEVDAIHEALRASLPIDDFFACYHDDADRCECRKPKPGLILQARDRYELDLQRSFLIGDRWRDIDAGARAGCTTILIDCGYTERAPSSSPTVIVKSLREAAQWISERSMEKEDSIREASK